MKLRITGIRHQLVPSEGKPETLVFTGQTWRSAVWKATAVFIHVLKIEEIPENRPWWRRLFG